MKELVEKLENWIKEIYKQENWCNYAIIGISGGKDSLVAAKLCVEALGSKKVHGVIIPNGEMVDFKDAVEACEILGITHSVVDIANVNTKLIDEISKGLHRHTNKSLNEQALINILPRLRMTVLYAIAATFKGMVVNTSNLSESIIGYSTKWGDNIGDFAPLLNLTKSEIVEIGKFYNLPKKLIEKTPSDGLSGKTDEEVIGINYDDIDTFIRTGNIKEEIKEKILRRYYSNEHKIKSIRAFEPSFKNFVNSSK